MLERHSGASRARLKQESARAPRRIAAMAPNGRDSPE
jgi:hypothetical protein